MPTCLRELQAMVRVCQQWSLRNRMQVNTDKTKIMAFFEIPFLHHARGGQHQPGPNMPLFHVYSPFPTPILAHTLSTKSTNLSTLALF